MKNNKLYDLGFILIFFVFFNILISSLMFIIKVPILKPNFSLSLLLTCFLYCYLMYKKQYSKKCIIVFLCLFLFIIITSIFVSGKIYDYTWDSNWYHKVSIGELKNGWNPVYESIKTFNESPKNPLKLKNVWEIWNDHYAKAYQIYAANVYKVTNNIETGKSMQIITILATFFICSGFLKSRIRSDYAILLAILLAANPIMISQFYTFYNDSLLGNYLIILIISLTIICCNDDVVTRKQNMLLFLMTLCLLINIKFTGFVYAGIYSFIYYLYIFIDKKQRKSNLKAITITAIISLIVGLGIIGLSTYPKNLIKHGNPFYPLYGNGKVNIMSNNTPMVFANTNYLKKFVISNFSKSYNNTYIMYNNYALKFPFTFETAELDVFNKPDVRAAGYGVLFSGALLLSLCVGIIVLIKMIKEKRSVILYLLPVLATLICILVMKENWWARYFPQLYLIPCIVVILLLKYPVKKNNNFLATFIIVVLFVNNWLICISVFKEIELQSKKIDEQFEVLKNASGKVLVYTNDFDGSVFNVKDRYMNIEVVKNIIGYKCFEIMGTHVSAYIYIKEE